MTIRGLIAADQAMVREGLRMILDLQDDIEVVAEAADGQAALRSAAEHRPDVVLMDIRMPGMDGLQATERLLRGGRPGPRVLVLTTFGEDEYLYAAMRAGASGFLLKDSPRAALLHAVRTVADGSALLDPALTRRLLEEWVRRPPPGAGVPEQLRRLTPRELEVFTGLARGRSNAELAAELVLSETTVKSHVAHVLAKLDLRDRIQAVVLGYESGLVRPGSAQKNSDDSG
ncbi:MAG: response regulator transcription factor [Blastococcus sp.]